MLVANNSEDFGSFSFVLPDGLEDKRHAKCLKGYNEQYQKIHKYYVVRKFINMMALADLYITLRILNYVSLNIRI